MMDLKVVRPPNSPSTSPLRMGDGYWRRAGDYRRLDAKTIPDRYLLLDVRDLTVTLKSTAAFFENRLG